jgi:hypothetical protein
MAGVPGPSRLLNQSCLVHAAWGRSRLAYFSIPVPVIVFSLANFAATYSIAVNGRANFLPSTGGENLDEVNTWTSIEDASLPSGNYSDLSYTAPYNITSPTTVSGTLTVSGGNDIVFYAVSPAKFYGIVLNVPDRITVSEQQ